jgi:CRP/FNR family transcriptional regulator, cyclic AMP receptor protein
MARDLNADILGQSFVLRGLPRHELEQLAGMMQRRAYRRGEVLMHQGDPGQALHVVCSGRLKVVTRNEGGEEALLAIVGPGDLVGDLALLDGGPRSATVIALEPVETATLARADFPGLLRRSPAVVEGLLAALAQTIRRLSEDVGDLMFLDLHGRLSKKLLELGDAHGRAIDGLIEIQVALTQGELAEMIGATRQRVNKLLGFYEARGAIARRGRRIVILRPEMLRRWASP